MTAAQRRLLDLWLNNPLDAAVNASMTEFANVFENQQTHGQIARHHQKDHPITQPGTPGVPVSRTRARSASAD